MKNLNENYYRYLVLGYIVFVGIIPCAEYLTCNGNISLHDSLKPMLFMTQNIFYALVGYYLEHVVDMTKVSRRKVLLVIIASVICVVVTCLMTYHQMLFNAITDQNEIERFFNCFICIPAMIVYYLIKRLGSRIKSVKIEAHLSMLGSAIFGVYLIEKFLRALTGWIYDLLNPIIGSFLASCLHCFFALFLGVIVVTSLKRIPKIGRLLNKFI